LNRSQSHSGELTTANEANSWAGFLHRLHRLLLNEIHKYIKKASI
jgi:hypothetical protein